MGHFITLSSTHLENGQINFFGVNSRTRRGHDSNRQPGRAYTTTEKRAETEYKEALNYQRTRGMFWHFGGTSLFREQRLLLQEQPTIYRFLCGAVIPITLGSLLGSAEDEPSAIATTTLCGENAHLTRFEEQRRQRRQC